MLFELAINYISFALFLVFSEPLSLNNSKLAGKCIPITRGGGIYQEHMNEALERLSDGAWVFIFTLCS